MVVEIKRTYEQGCTIGTIIVGGRVFGFTMEPAWLGNMVNVSCIPEDTYICKRVDSPKHGETFEVMNVYGRTNILFHSLNIIEETGGCIGIGSEAGYIYEERAILESRKAFDKFMALMTGIDEFKLIIK